MSFCGVALWRINPFVPQVYLHYCTSDDFSGLRNASLLDPYYFHGSRVVPAVFAVELLVTFRVVTFF